MGHRISSQNIDKKRKRSARSEGSDILDASDIENDEDEDAVDTKYVENIKRVVRNKANDDDFSDERIKHSITTVNSQLDTIINTYKSKVSKKKSRSNLSLHSLSQEEKRIKSERKENRNNKRLQIHDIC